MTGLPASGLPTTGLPGSGLPRVDLGWSDLPRVDLGWSDLPGRRVGIYGLGREGRAALRACRARGIEPVLVDDAPREPGTIATTSGGSQALLGCDVVIVAPGVPRRGAVLSGLDAAGVAVAGGLGLWLHDADLSRVVVVTGTKGKSTTAAIAGHLLTGLGSRALLAGNIGVPPFDPEHADDFDHWVVEVSSYQACTLPVAPPVVGVTSLHPDHLPWHGDAETYFADKLSVCRLPGAELTVANGDSELLRARRDQLGPRVEWVHDGEAAWAEPLGLVGAHNRRNALIARRLLLALGIPGADDDAVMHRAATGFAGLESRLQVVLERDGVRFVDDGLSTNVLPTLAAVDAFDGQRVALIVGGQDRGIDYRPLATGLAGRKDLLVLTVPDNGPRIASALASFDLGPGVEVRAADDLEHAVRAAYDWAAGRGVVLLSPAAPSFGRFTDYRHRAAAFTAAARSLPSAPPLS